MLMIGNIQFLASLLNEVEESWRDPLRKVLRSSDVREIHGNPQLNRVSVILARARLRMSNSTKLGLETFGLPNLIVELERLATDRELETYGIENAAYAGSCFVSDKRMIGCEFVKRGMSKTVPYNGD
jgi:hypothetical protein